jgi:hypothetical protein
MASPYYSELEFVEVRWRSLFRSNSLGKRCTSYNAPPTSRKRAADRWSLQHFLPRSSLFVVGKAQKLHGATYGLYGGCSDGVPPIQFFQAEYRIKFGSRPMRFLGFSKREKGAPGQEISKWSTVCSKFSISGWSVVRSVSLAKGGTSKKRPSSYLHKVPTRMSVRTFQTDLVHIYIPWYVLLQNILFTYRRKLCMYLQGSCSTHERNKKFVQNFARKTWRNDSTPKT